MHKHLYISILLLSAYDGGTLGSLEARDLCCAALKYKGNNPSTYDPSLLT